MLQKIKAIIFDFDGVIAESVNVKTEAFAEIYRPYGKEIEAKVVEHHLKNGGMSRFEKFKIYHDDFLNKPITENQVQELANKFSELVVQKVIEAPYVKGAYEFLDKYHKKFDFFISSGTPQNEIRLICRERKIDHYFNEIYGSPIKKDEHVKKIVNDYHYCNDEVVFIGDAESDRRAAENNNIIFIGRSSGENIFKNERYTLPDLSPLINLLRDIEK